MRSLRRITSVILVMVVLLSVALAGCAPKQAEPAPAAKAPANVAVVFATGGLGDKSFNDSVYAGLERAQKELGITMQYVEPKEIAEYEGHHREFAKAKNFNLIFAIGYDQADAVSKVAAEFPEQKWVMIDGEAKGDNVASVFFRDNEKAFLMGVILGKMTTTNKIGIVNGMDIPLIEKFTAGFRSGIAYVNKDCKLEVKYVGAWDDVNTGKELARSLYDDGCDIIYTVSGGSGLGVHEAAKEMDKFSAGSNGNQNYLDPDHIIASTMRKLDELVYTYIKDIIDGKFTGGLQTKGVKENFMDATNEGSNIKLPQEVIDAKESARKAIVDGTIEVPDTEAKAQEFISKLP